MLSRQNNSRRNWSRLNGSRQNRSRRTRMLPPSLFLTYACVLATLAFPVSIFIIADIVPLSVFTATALGSPSPSQWISCALYTIPNSPIVEYSYSRQLKMYLTCAHNIITWKCRWKLEVLKFYVATCMFDCKNVCVYMCAVA